MINRRVSVRPPATDGAAGRASIVVIMDSDYPANMPPIAKAMRTDARVARAASLLATAWLAAGVHAEPLVLEQFDYEGVDQPLNGLDGGEGFAGPWVVDGWGRNYDVGRTIFAPNPGVLGNTVNERGGLDFDGLPTAGSALARYGTAGQRGAHRELSASAQAALTADNTTIWFSVLASPPNNNRFGTLIFGTDRLIALQGATDNANLSSPTGQGFGVGFRTDNGGIAGGGPGSPNAVAFASSASATVDIGSYVPPLAPGGTHHDVVLVVGKINWRPQGTDDELFLFNLTSSSDPEPAESAAIASLAADMEQSTWDMISLQDTGSTIYDEIRFGTSFGDVTGSGPAGAFAIRDFTYAPDGGMLSLTWDSRGGATYSVKYSTDGSDWSGDLDDGVDADPGETTTRAFDIGGLAKDGRILFRVERN